MADPASDAIILGILGIIAGALATGAAAGLAAIGCVVGSLIASFCVGIPCVSLMGLGLPSTLCCLPPCGLACTSPFWCPALCATFGAAASIWMPICTIGSVCCGSACFTSPCWIPSIPCLAGGCGFLTMCTPLGIIGCMLTEPWWYPVERICFASLCPPEEILHGFDLCSQIVCFGLPPACGLTGINTGLEACVNVAPCHLINTVGYTTCSNGLSVVKSMCGLGWLEQIYASSCSLIISGCSAYSPWLCLAGVYSSYLSCLSSNPD